MKADTIVAAATNTAVRSGVAVIRLSGDNALEIAGKLSGGKRFKSREAAFCVIDTGEVQDETLIITFEKPRSYTGEDMAEIHCHGNPLIVSEIIKFCVNNGTRIAEAGEFTKRAYLNGKADLTASEAVADIISAETKVQLFSAAKLREGRLFKEIEVLQSEIYDLIAELNAAIDYPEEDVDAIAIANVKVRAVDLKEKLLRLAATYNSGKLIKDGAKVAIFGAPNVGKSSLLNRLLNKDRAIVSAVPGTTRDTVEDRYEYNGIIFSITDTAGIREAGEDVERIGIERARAAANDCDIVLAVSDEEGKWICPPQNKPVLFIRNKIDLVTEKKPKNGQISNKRGDIISNKNACETDEKNDIIKTDKSYEEKARSGDILEASALVNINIDKIKQALYDISCGELSMEGFVLTNLRHYEAVNAAASFLETAINCAVCETPEIISIDLLDASNELGKVTGLIGSDEIVNRIFSKFCVGK